MKTETLQVPGASLYYEVRGSGPVLLMIPGGPMDADGFKDIADRLAGLPDELTIELVPVVLGRDVRLLDGLEPGTADLELIRVIDAPGVTHLTYQVIR